jgi:E3 SUMO-protein ligase PIAS1
VTIQPEGKWELHIKTEPPRKSNGFASNDLIEITELGDAVTNSTSRFFGTPISAPRRDRAPSSAAPRGPASTSAKRPIAMVIELTLSCDEDDQPLVHPLKRQYSSSFPDSPTVYRPAPPPPPPANGTNGINGANGYPRP